MATTHHREDHEKVLERIKHDFDERLAALAGHPHQWVQFVEQAAVFGAHYSLGNQILLSTQAYRRGMIARYFLPFGNKLGTTGWKAHGRQVRRGEKAFTIWAPILRRPTDEQAAEREAGGRSVRRDAQGRPARQVVGFRLASVFELAQTEGEPFEPPTIQRRRLVRAAGGRLPQLLTGDDPTGAFDDVVALIRAAGYRFELAEPGSRYLGRANGVTVGVPHRLVQVRDDLDAAQRTKTAIHELAHLRCGHVDAALDGQSVHRGRAETEAESIAHLVCRALGLDTRAYSDAYVLGWADGDLEVVKACAQTVLRVARTILADLDPDAQPDVDRADTDAERADTDAGATDPATPGSPGCGPVESGDEAGER